MPYYDETGPEGFGPLTGRGLGSCAGQGVASRRFGMGRGRGLRGGYGCRYFSPVITQDEEVEMLKEDQKALQEDIKAVERRLKEIGPK